jgi:hypothetical protein
MKKVFGALLVFVICCFLGGCSDIKLDMTIGKKGNISECMSCTIDLDAATEVMHKMKTKPADYTKEDLWKYLVMCESEQSEITRKVIDGKDCAVEVGSPDQYSSVEHYYYHNLLRSDSGLRFSESEFAVKTPALINELATYKLDENVKQKNYIKELYKTMTLTFSITFSYPITYIDSHGSIDPTNPNKAIWKGNYYDIYSWKTICARCNNGIKVRGVAQGALTRKTVKLSYAGVKSATVNGKKLKSKKFTKSGTYNVILRSANGNQQTVYFTIDKEKPLISGVKNGKTYKKYVSINLWDKNEIKSATLNGKNTKYKFFVTKKGKYVLKVTDYAGNVKKVKFRLK